LTYLRRLPSRLRPPNPRLPRLPLPFGFLHRLGPFLCLTVDRVDPCLLGLLGLGLTVPPLGLGRRLASLAPVAVDGNAFGGCTFLAFLSGLTAPGCTLLLGSADSLTAPPFYEVGMGRRWPWTYLGRLALLFLLTVQNGLAIGNSGRIARLGRVRPLGRVLLGPTGIALLADFGTVFLCLFGRAGDVELDLAAV
jgi:hypothetical protein